ncbi:unnamed protein product [Caretta caretta]
MLVPVPALILSTVLARPLYTRSHRGELTGVNVPVLSIACGLMGQGEAESAERCLAEVGPAQMVLFPTSAFKKIWNLQREWREGGQILIAILGGRLTVLDQP